MYKTPLTLFPVRAIGRVQMLAVLVCRNIHVARHSVTTRPLSAAILDRKNASYGERKATTRFRSAPIQTKPHIILAID